MLLRLHKKENQVEPEIVITYSAMSEEIQTVISTVKAIDVRIACKQDGKLQQISASSIYYVESVDKKTFLYGETQVYETGYKLYELEERLKEAGFARINKACILNTKVLTAIKPQLNSRLEANLSNGEKLYVSRKYLSEIKRILKGVSA